MASIECCNALSRYSSSNDISYTQLTAYSREFICKLEPDFIWDDASFVALSKARRGLIAVF